MAVGAELDKFFAVITNHFGFQQYFHTLSGAYIVGGFFVMGVGAYHILRRQHLEFFKKSFRFALIFALILSVAEVVQGHIHGAEVAKIQPAKLAAMESLWDTQAGAPQTLFLIPDEKYERNAVEVGVGAVIGQILSAIDPVQLQEAFQRAVQRPSA